MGSADGKSMEIDCARYIYIQTAVESVRHTFKVIFQLILDC